MKLALDFDLRVSYMCTGLCKVFDACLQNNVSEKLTNQHSRNKEKKTKCRISSDDNKKIFFFRIINA